MTAGIHVGTAHRWCLHKQFSLPDGARATNLLIEIIGFRLRNDHLGRVRQPVGVSHAGWTGQQDLDIVRLWCLPELWSGTVCAGISGVTVLPLDGHYHCFLAH